MKNSLSTSKYGPIVHSGTITVPHDYTFGIHIDSFIKSEGKNLKVLGNAISDKNYIQASNKFCPVKIYYYEVLPVIEYIDNCQQCLNDLLKESELLFFGAQGLCMYKQHIHYPLSGKLLSFDKKDNLFKNQNCEKLPYMQHCSDGTTEFSTINFWSSIGSKGNNLLLYYEL